MVVLCTHIFNISTSDFNAKLTAMEHILKVLSYHGQIDAQISTNSCQIGPKNHREHREKLQAPCYSILPEMKWSPGMIWDGAYVMEPTISAATPLHCLAMALLFNCQNLQKVGLDIVIFNGNVPGHAWHTWCKKGTNGKRMSCSSLTCHMHIFKLIDFRTMGIWIWITFFFIRIVYTN